MTATTTRSPQEIYAAAFAAPRDPRSAAYKRGVLDGLKAKLERHVPMLPYNMGTAEADAYFSGISEGRALADRERDATPNYPGDGIGDGR